MYGRVVDVLFYADNPGGNVRKCQLQYTNDCIVIINPKVSAKVKRKKIKPAQSKQQSKQRNKPHQNTHKKRKINHRPLSYILSKEKKNISMKRFARENLRAVHTLTQTRTHTRAARAHKHTHACTHRQTNR